MIHKTLIFLLVYCPLIFLIVVALGLLWDFSVIAFSIVAWALLATLILFMNYRYWTFVDPREDENGK